MYGSEGTGKKRGKDEKGKIGGEDNREQLRMQLAKGTKFVPLASMAEKITELGI